MDTVKFIRKLRPEGWQGAAIFLCSFVVYLLSMPPSVTTEDSGELILASYFGASMAHPPGYPLYALLGQVFTWLPMGTIGWRINFMSAVWASGTAVFLAVSARQLGVRPVLAGAGAIALAFSTVFWSQATIAEVYSLNTCLFFSLLALTLRIDDDLPRFFWVGYGLIGGLALANHWPLVVLSSPGILLLVLHKWKLVKDSLPSIIIGTLLGLAPYLWLVLRSHGDNTIGFYGAIESLDDFLYLVKREGFANVDSAAAAMDGDKWRYLTFFLQELGTQLTWLGIPLAALGSLHLWRTKGAITTTSLGLIFLGSSFVLISQLSFAFDGLWRSIFQVYPLIPYGVAAIFFALGLERIAKTLEEKNINNGDRIVAAVALGVAGFLLASNWQDNNRRDDFWAVDYGRAVLDALPKDAVLFTSTDTDTGPIAYLSYAEGYRPDVTVYNRQGLLFGNRLFPHTTPEREKERKLAAFIRNSKREVFFTHVGDITPPKLGFGFEEQGLIRRALPNQPAGFQSAVDNQASLSFAEAVLKSQAPKDYFTAYHKEMLLLTFGSYIAMLETSGTELSPNVKDLGQALKEQTYGVFGYLFVKVQSKAKKDLQQTWQWTESIKAEQQRLLTRKHQANLYNLRGAVAFYDQRKEDAEKNWLTAINLFPKPGNGAITTLMRFDATHGNKRRFEKMRRKYFPGGLPGDLAALEQKLKEKSE